MRAIVLHLPGEFARDLTATKRAWEHYWNLYDAFRARHGMDATKAVPSIREPRAICPSLVLSGTDHLFRSTSLVTSPASSSSLASSSACMYRVMDVPPMTSPLRAAS